MMKARYIFIICVLNLLVNVGSIYNIFFGICSIFLLMLVFIPQVFVTVVNKANSVEEDKRNLAVRNLADYGSQKSTQFMNKFAMIFGFVVVYAMAVLFTILQNNKREDFHSFISTHFHSPYMFQITQVLSVLGYVLLVISLFLATIHSIRLMKNERVFTGE